MKYSTRGYSSIPAIPPIIKLLYGLSRINETKIANAKIILYPADKLYRRLFFSSRSTTGFFLEFIISSMPVI